MPDDVKATWIGTVTLRWACQESPRVLVHKGGTRSGKTYNACIAWADYLMNEGAGETLSIVRATGPALKSSVIEDMVEVLRRMNLYSEKRHNKTEMRIELPSGSRIDYFPTDDEQKVHGRNRHHLWGNEANEISIKAWRQLVLRTRHKVMLDFNPSFAPGHWINKEYDGSSDAIWYTSTYEDNPHLTDEQRREIESLKDKDPWAWKVYGLGKQARPAAAIYRRVEALSEWTHDRYVYGLDFGYNNPMSLNRVARVDVEGAPELHIWSMLHESYLTTQDLIDRLPLVGVSRILKHPPVGPEVAWSQERVRKVLRHMGVTKNDRIICDGAEPDRIEMLNRAGYNAEAADKGKGTVKAGIDFCKQHVIKVGGPASEKPMQEFQNYRWKRHAGTDELMDEPEDGDDHAPDAVRYAAFTEFAGPGVQIF